MKRSKTSIGSKMQKYLFFAIILAIGILWIIQGAFMEPIYRFVKQNEMRSIAYQIRDEKILYVEELEAKLDNNSYVVVVTKDLTTGVVYPKPIGKGPSSWQFLDKLSYENLFVTLGNQGEQFENKRGDNGILAYALRLNESQIVVVYSQMVPFRAMTNTIFVQLILVSGVLLLLSVPFNRYLYRKISTPIMEINEDAKILTQNIYTKDFAATGYKEIEELSLSLNQMREGLARVDMLRNELMANVSHDLRTPLTMIAGYTEMMKDIEGEMNEENLDLILEETRYLNKLVSDMLDLSAIQSGMSALHLEATNINDLLDRVVSRFRHFYRDRRIEVDNPGAIEVKVDAFKIEQVLYNLINNAYIHTEKNIYVSLRRMSDKTVRIAVRDEGEGLSEEEKHSVWQKYYQSDRNHSRGRGGSGLGLSIVQQIFERHQIVYGIESEKGKGSLFWFELEIL